jgi:hypothetical protein
MRRVYWVLLLFLVGCPIHAPEPKQNERWTIPPEKYGTTTVEGLTSPGYADAGVD